MHGKEDTYYGIDLTFVGKHAFNNNTGSVKNIKYFETSNGKNGRLCKFKSIKYFQYTAQSIKLTTESRIYVDTAYCEGTIRYIGIPPDKSDVYIGVELDVDNGDCDGTYKGNGARYFQCESQKGIYIPCPSDEVPSSSKPKAKGTVSAFPYNPINTNISWHSYKPININICVMVKLTLNILQYA